MTTQNGLPRDEDQDPASLLPVPLDDAQAKLNQQGYSADAPEDPEDQDIPQLRLMAGNSQPVRDDDARPGDWWLPGIGVVKNPVLKLIGRKVTRELREDENINPDRPVLCWSDNGIRGMGEPGGPCRECPYARSSGGWPPCTRVTNFACLLLTDVGLGDDPLPVVLSLRRSAGREATMVLNNLFRAEALHSKVALSSRQAGSGNRTYHRVVASIQA